MPEAFCPQSVTLVLEHDLDISRGDLVIGLENLPGMSGDLHARVCWMHPRPLQKGNKYFLKHSTQTVQAIVTSVENRINIQNFEPEAVTEGLPLNAIGEIRLKTSRPSSTTATPPTGSPARSFSSSRAPTPPWPPACCSRPTKP